MYLLDLQCLTRAYTGLVLFSLNMLTKFFAEKIKNFFFLDANILEIMANMRK